MKALTTEMLTPYVKGQMEFTNNDTGLVCRGKIGMILVSEGDLIVRYDWVLQRHTAPTPAWQECQIGVISFSLRGHVLDSDEMSRTGRLVFRLRGVGETDIVRITIFLPRDPACISFEGAD